MEKQRNPTGILMLLGLACIILVLVAATCSSCSKVEKKQEKPIRSLTPEPVKVTLGTNDLEESNILSIKSIHMDSLRSTILTDSIGVSLTPVPKKEVKLLTPQEELDLILPKLMQYRFDHSPIPPFKGNVFDPQSWEKYILFVDSLLPSALKPDCYFLQEDSLRFRTLNNDKKQSNIFLCLSSPNLIYKNVSSGMSENYVYTTDYLIDDNRTVIRMMLPQPELLLSRDVWDVFVDHEFVHAKELLGMVPTAEYCDAEMLAYVSSLNLLKSKNKRTWNAFVKYAGRFYQQYGFGNELRKMCAVLYRTDELSFLERDMMEPALLLIVAMYTENITGLEKDNEKFAETMNNLYAYLDSNEALAYQ